MKDSTVALFCCLDAFAKIYNDWQHHHMGWSRSWATALPNFPATEGLLALMPKTGSTEPHLHGMVFGFKLHLHSNHQGQIMILTVGTFRLGHQLRRAGSRSRLLAKGCRSRPHEHSRTLR